MKHSLRILFGIAFVFSAGQRHVSGQTVIRGSPMCTTCRIRLERVTQIGGLDTDVSETLLVARDSRGRLFVALEGHATEIRVFSSSGQLLRQLGRPGGGPGEYRLIRGLRLGIGDSLYVYDFGHARIDVYDPALRLERSIQTVSFINSSNGWWVVPQLGYVVNASIRSRSLSGIPMHAIDAQGKLIMSFGSQDGVFKQDLQFSWMRRAAVVSDGIWTMHVNEYVLEKWNKEGSRAKHIRRDAGWFEPWWTYPAADLPSPPLGIGLDIDSNGRLWTVTLVPSSTQKAFRKIKTGERGATYAEYIDEEKSFDSVIEILEPNTARLVASTRVDQKLLVVLGNQYYAGYRQGPDGIGFIDIWRATFSHR